MILQKGGPNLATVVVSALSTATVVVRSVTVKNGWFEKYNNI
jgi:hypothetical protein